MIYETFTIQAHGDVAEQLFITLTIDENNAKTFPADESNPDYVQFLTDAQLTDAKVQTLKSNTWYDFPTEETN